MTFPTPEERTPDSERERKATEEAADQFYRDGGGFHWRWPHFDRTVPADKRPRAGLDRYPHNVVGAYVVAFGRCWGVRWKGSRW